MIDSPAALVVQAYCQTHDRILAYLETLSDAQLHWRLNSQSHPIAFHAWHLGRWSDHFQAAVPGMTPELGQRLPAGFQIWQQERIGEQWGFAGSPLGYAETGMGMPDEAAFRLPFPAKGILLDYVGRTFTLGKRAVEAIDEAQFQCIEQPQPLTEGIWGGKTVGAALMVHVTHANRHLGMMECLVGLQGLPGTATL